VRLQIIFLFLTAIGTSILANPKAKADTLEKSIFQIKKSDTAIKPFVFPKSMTVIRSCYPNENECLFLYPDSGIVGIDKAVSKNFEIIAKVLNDEKAIKKYLIRLDPARIAPSKRGKDPKELYLTKRKLKEIGKRNDADFIFIFVRTINHFPPRSIQTQGRIYLVRQNKVLVVPSNNQALELNTPNLTKQLEEINRNGLQQLAKDARKVIHSHKFEKRRSNY
jgi:hypothetical protein